MFSALYVRSEVRHLLVEGLDLGRGFCYRNGHVFSRHRSPLHLETLSPRSLPRLPWRLLYHARRSEGIGPRAFGGRERRRNRTLLEENGETIEGRGNHLVLPSGNGPVHADSKSEPGLLLHGHENAALHRLRKASRGLQTVPFRRSSPRILSRSESLADFQGFAENLDRQFVHAFASAESLSCECRVKINGGSNDELAGEFSSTHGKRNFQTLFTSRFNP